MSKLWTHFVLLLLILVTGVRAADTPQDPEEPAVFFYSEGVHAYFAGEYEEALSSLDIAIEHGNGDPRSYYFRGLAYLRGGQKSLAALDFAHGARLELRRIDRYRLAQDETKRLSEVNRALERVQGEPRRMLERHRLPVYPAVRDAQSFKHLQIERIRTAAISAARDIEAKQALEFRSFQQLVGVILDFHGERLRIVAVSEHQNGIRSLAVLPADVSLDPSRYANTFVNTGDGFVTGEDALTYQIAKSTRQLPAAYIGELKLEVPQLHLVYNPLHAILSSPDEAREGRRQFNINEAARREREAELARERQRQLEEQRRQEAIRLARELELEEIRRRERQRIAAERAAPYYYDVDAEGKALLDIGLAALAQWAKRGYEREDRPILAGLAGLFRDNRIKAAIRDVFPNLDDRTVGSIESVVSRYCDGELTMENLVRDQVEQEFQEQLNQLDPGLGKAYPVVKFLAEVHDHCQQLKGRD